MKVKLIGWRINKSTSELLEKIAKTLADEYKKITNNSLEHEIIDSFNTNIENTDKPIIVFGEEIAKELNAKEEYWYWILPSVDKLKSKQEVKIRKETYSKIKIIANELTNIEEDKLYAEVDNIKIGKLGSDIIITDEELEYLKNIKKLLDNPKMVITKNNIKIEIG